jgi:hypothetical protein
MMNKLYCRPNGLFKNGKYKNKIKSACYFVTAAQLLKDAKTYSRAAPALAAGYLLLPAGVCHRGNEQPVQTEEPGFFIMLFFQRSDRKMS